MALRNRGILVTTLTILLVSVVSCIWLHSLAIAENEWHNVLDSSSKAQIALDEESRSADTFLDCVSNENCHILYHHVQKTGGSFLASTLYPVLNGENYKSKYWCCGTPFMNRFRNSMSEYCDNKLAVYEVYGSQFEEIVSSCLDYYKKHNQRAVALMTVREPIQRTLSMIHMRCNKNFDVISDQAQAICQRCSYHADRDHWDVFARKTNQVYSDLLYQLPIDSLVLDNLLMDDFLHNVETELQIHLPDGRRNAERKHVCDFGMTSDMFKQLEHSQRIFKRLTTGIRVGTTKG